MAVYAKELKGLTPAQIKARLDRERRTAAEQAEWDATGEALNQIILSTLNRKTARGTGSDSVAAELARVMSRIAG